MPAVSILIAQVCRMTCGVTCRSVRVGQVTAARVVCTAMRCATASQLVISPHTAKTHINRSMTKLNISDRAQLVVIAYQTGLATILRHEAGSTNGPPPTR